jgi:hypothetical protein
MLAGDPARRAIRLAFVSRFWLIAGWLTGKTRQPLDRAAQRLQLVMGIFCVDLWVSVSGQLLADLRCNASVRQCGNERIPQGVKCLAIGGTALALASYNASDDPSFLD